MKKKIVVTGKEKDNRDLSEIITGRKANKFSGYKTREVYKSALYDMGHVELYQEVIRVGSTPSSEKEFCRQKCLDAFDRAHRPRATMIPDIETGNLEDIVKQGRERHLKEEAKKLKAKKL